jgi:hypothetical protein
MPGQYLTARRVRPHSVGSKSAEEVPARLFLCGRCRAQVLICSRCDRGQIYCGQRCAQEARRSAQRAANKRYQTSHRGRIKHAARARRYRSRQKNVTYRGSRPQLSGVLVSKGSAPSASKQNASEYDPRPLAWQCYRCGRSCSPFVRQGFLPRRRAPRTHQRRRGSDRDYFR